MDQIVTLVEGVGVWLDTFRFQGFTGLDLAVGLIMLVSTLLAYLRGLVRETVTLASWLGAIVVTYLFYPQVQQMLEGTIDDVFLLFVAAVGGTFVVSLIVFKIVAYFIGRLIEDSPLEGIDRFLGLLFGIARGGLVSIALYVALLFAFGAAAVPSWVSEARLRPQLNEGYAWLREQLPQLPDPAQAGQGVSATGADEDETPPPAADGGG